MEACLLSFLCMLVVAVVVKEDDKRREVRAVKDSVLYKDEHAVA